MELRRIGKVNIDRDRQFPNLPSPRTTSIIGKSIANHLHVTPTLPSRNHREIAGPAKRKVAACLPIPAACCIK